MESDYLQHSRLWFPEGIAPFGEFNLMRSDHRLLGDAKMDAVLCAAGPSVVMSAWENSSWLKDVLSENHQAQSLTTSQQTHLSSPVGKDIISATFSPDKQGAWFAIAPPIYELEKGDALIRGLGRFLVPSQVVGFANAKHDISGNFLQQTVKQLRHPEKIYAAVSNIDVRPNNQHKGLGTALLYFSLGMFKPEQHATTYVAEKNQSLIEKLSELGYQPTGSQSREGLIEGVTIEEVRLQAPRVDRVRNELVAGFPWLQEGVRMGGSNWFDIY